MKASLIFLLPVILIPSLAFVYGDKSMSNLVQGEKENYVIGYITHDIGVNPDWSENYISQITENASLVGSPLINGFFAHFLDNLNKYPELKELEIRSFDNPDTLVHGIQGRELVLGLVVDENFSHALLSGVNFRYYSQYGKYLSNDSQFLRITSEIGLIGDFSYELFSEVYLKLSSAMNSFLQVYMEPVLNLGEITINQKNIERIEFTEFQIELPGFLVYILILSISGSVGTLASERDSHTILRIRLSGFSRRKLILGIAISQLVVTFIQILMFFLTIYIMRFPMFENTWFLLPLSLLNIIPLLGMGLIIAAFVKDTNLALSIPSLLGIPLIFLTGSFIPLPSIYIGEFLVWYLNPFYVIGEISRKVLLFGETPSAMLFEIYLILLYGLIYFSVGVVLLGKRIYK